MNVTQPMAAAPVAKGAIDGVPVALPPADAYVRFFEQLVRAVVDLQARVKALEEAGP